MAPTITTKEKHKNDVSAIMNTINDNGGDLWATADGKVCKGSPFSTRAY
jgi:hypothetical protein